MRKSVEWNRNKNLIVFDRSFNANTILVPSFHICCSQLSSILANFKPNKKRNQRTKREKLELNSKSICIVGQHIWMEWSSQNVCSSMHNEPTGHCFASIFLSYSFNLLYPHSLNIKQSPRCCLGSKMANILDICASDWIDLQLHLLILPRVLWRLSIKIVQKHCWMFLHFYWFYLERQHVESFK